MSTRLGPVDHLPGLELVLVGGTSFDSRVCSSSMARYSSKRAVATAMAGTSSPRWKGFTR